MAIKNTVSSIFYLCLLIVKSVFNCGLSGVIRSHHFLQSSHAVSLIRIYVWPIYIAFFLLSADSDQLSSGKASEYTVLIEIMQLNWLENRSEYAILVYSARQRDVVVFFWGGGGGLRQKKKLSFVEDFLCYVRCF